MTTSPTGKWRPDDLAFAAVSYVGLAILTPLFIAKYLEREGKRNGNER